MGDYCANCGDDGDTVDISNRPHTYYCNNCKMVMIYKVASSHHIKPLDQFREDNNAALER